MNIFFTGAISGGRGQQPDYEHIVSVLEKHGTVLSAHVSDESLSEYGETRLSGTEILEREQEALSRADIIVAEVTTPSLGVGYLVGRATSLGKRVVALYEGGDALRLSGIIKGDPLIAVHTYETKGDIEKVLEGALR